MKVSLSIGENKVEIKTLKVARFIPDLIELYWQIESDGVDLSQVSIDIYRSQAPNDEDLSGYELLEENFPANSLFYSDDSLRGLQHGTRVWYYKIKLKDDNDPDNFTISDYVYLNSGVPDRKWLKIYNHKVMSLKKGGRFFFLLKKRTWGERPSNWDPILFHATSEIDEEDNSFGRGWKDAFFPPIPFYGMVTPNPRVKDISIWGEFYPSDIVLTMLNRPPLEIGDIIVDPKKDLKYYVQRTRTLEKLGSPIEQQSQLSLIHLDDEIYSYSIKDYITGDVSLPELSPDEKFVIFDEVKYVIF